MPGVSVPIEVQEQLVAETNEREAALGADSLLYAAVLAGFPDGVITRPPEARYTCIDGSPIEAWEEMTVAWVQRWVTIQRGRLAWVPALVKPGGIELMVTACSLHAEEALEYITARAGELEANLSTNIILANQNLSYTAESQLFPETGS